ncbi:hypothetical protein ABZ892_29535 [Streptomyces sp. NPDC046924]
MGPAYESPGGPAARRPLLPLALPSLAVEHVRDDQGDPDDF